MRVDRVVALADAGHVVHARSPAARPVGAVGPRTVQTPPFGIGAQRREDAVEPFRIAELTVVDQLDPGQQIGSRRRGVVPLEAVRAVGADLAADESVGVLPGVEVVERALEREVAVAVAGIHHHEGHVPHEDVSVVGDVEVGRYESRPLLGLADVAHGDAPGVPVHLDLAVVPLPEGGGEDLPRLVERTRENRLGLGRAVFVLGDEDLLDVGILVGELVGSRLEPLGGGRQGQQSGRNHHAFHSGWFRFVTWSVRGCGGRSPY